MQIVNFSYISNLQRQKCGTIRVIATWFSLSYLSHRLTHRKETYTFEISVRLINVRKYSIKTDPNLDFHGNRKRRKVNVAAHSLLIHTRSF
jgi:hypothetical protein